VQGVSALVATQALKFTSNACTLAYSRQPLITKEQEKERARLQVPDGVDIDVFRAYIETLPGQESPGIFGLHANADLTFRTLQVQDAIYTILDTMPKGGGGGGGLSREDIVDKICEDLLSKCPPMFDNEDTKEKCAKLPGGPTMPLTVTLRQARPSPCFLSRPMWPPLRCLFACMRYCTGDLLRTDLVSAASMTHLAWLSAATWLRTRQRHSQATHRSVTA
jgi:hypothetical protein